MEKMRYKNFSWPENPGIFQEELLREPQYISQNGGVFFDRMGKLKRKIIGEGVFLGETAYEDFQALRNLAESSSPGYLSHPIWGQWYCYLTELEMIMESRENFVRYRIAFTGVENDGSVVK